MYLYVRPNATIATQNVRKIIFTSQKNNIIVSSKEISTEKND